MQKRKINITYTVDDKTVSYKEMCFIIAATIRDKKLLSDDIDFSSLVQSLTRFYRDGFRLPDLTFDGFNYVLKE